MQWFKGAAWGLLFASVVATATQSAIPIVFQLEREGVRLEVVPGTGFEESPVLYFMLFDSRTARMACFELDVADDIPVFITSLADYLRQPKPSIIFFWGLFGYRPWDDFQVVGLGDAILIRMVEYVGNEDLYAFIAIRLDHTEVKQLISALQEFRPPHW